MKRFWLYVGEKHGESWFEDDFGSLESAKEAAEGIDPNKYMYVEIRDVEEGWIYNCQEDENSWDRWHLKGRSVENVS